MVTEVDTLFVCKKFSILLEHEIVEQSSYFAFPFNEFEIDEL